MPGTKTLTKVFVGLQGQQSQKVLTINVLDNSLSRKWVKALENVLQQNLFLEKNFCFLGFADSDRNGEYILNQVNDSIDHINSASLGYKIKDRFTMADCLDQDLRIKQDRFNQLHLYFEDLQGVSGAMSEFWQQADTVTRWHIRQLNLLCHEFECWAKSWRKKIQAPEWQRPSQLMCWLTAPRFQLETEDLELFGIETLNRPLGAVYVGVNKGLGKHHWEVFNDENRDVHELTTTTLRGQSEAAADFDIEWGIDPGNYEFQKNKLSDFRSWLIRNGWDPNDPTLTIGHPQIGQVDLMASFGTTDHDSIWQQLSQHSDVAWISCGSVRAEYNYTWQDHDFRDKQIKALQQEKHR